MPLVRLKDRVVISALAAEERRGREQPSHAIALPSKGIEGVASLRRRAQLAGNEQLEPALGIHSDVARQPPDLGRKQRETRLDRGKLRPVLCPGLHDVVTPKTRQHIGAEPRLALDLARHEWQLPLDQGDGQRLSTIRHPLVTDGIPDKALCRPGGIPELQSS